MSLVDNTVASTVPLEPAATSSIFGRWTGTWWWRYVVFGAMSNALRPSRRTY